MLNNTTLKSLKKSLLGEALLLTNEEVSAFLNSDNVDPVQENEQVIGQLEPIEAALFTLENKKIALVYEMDQQLRELSKKFFGEKPRNVLKEELSKFKSENAKLIEECGAAARATKILAELAWTLLKIRIGKAATEPETIGYRKDGKIVAVAQEDHEACPGCGKRPGPDGGIQVIEVDTETLSDILQGIFGGNTEKPTA